MLKKIGIASIVVALLSGAQLGFAKEAKESPVSLERAVKQAKKEMDGKVLSTRTKKSKDGWVHKIRILSKEGKVKTLEYPAKPPKEED